MTGLWSDRRGAVTLLAAGVMVAGVGGLSFAADMGSVYLTARRLQGIADAAALSAAANIATPQAAAQATVAGNGWGTRATIGATPGVWTPAATVGNRFAATATSPNAVQVSLQTDAPLFFGRMFGRRTVHLTRRATAARRDMAAFSIGSRLAAVDPVVANALLSGLIGGSGVTLTLADYQALASADIDLLAFAGVMRQQLHVASFNDALALGATPAKAIQAASGALVAPNAAASAALAKLATAAGAMPAVPLASLLSLGPIGLQDHATRAGGAIGVNALGFARNLLELSGGARQVGLNLGTGIPGLLGVTVRYATGARQGSTSWTTLTAKNDAQVSTAQSRLFIDAYVGDVSTLYGLAQVHLPLYVELAQASAKLGSLTCLRGAKRLELQVQPSPGHVSIAGFADPTAFANHATPLVETDATIVSLLNLVSIKGRTRTDLSGGGWQTTPFTNAEIDAGATHTVNSTNFAGGIAGSLASKLTLTVQIGPLKLPDLGLGRTVGTLLTTTAPAVDRVLASLIGLLGVGVGQADVHVDGVRCGVPALVA